MSNAEREVTRMDREEAIARMQAEVREVNEANGWYEEERSVGEDVALLHSEVSEMLEAYRDHGLDDATGREFVACRDPQCGDSTWDHECTVGSKPGKPEGFGSECADVLVRLLDTCDRRGVDLAAEFERKLAFNRQRGYRHGGKRL